MKPKTDDVVLIPRALNRGRFIITATDRQCGQNYVHIESEHNGSWANGWILQSSVEHCYSIAIVRHLSYGVSIVQSMSDCNFQPELYLISTIANFGNNLEGSK